MQSQQLLNVFCGRINNLIGCLVLNSFYHNSALPRCQKRLLPGFSPARLGIKRLHTMLFILSTPTGNLLPAYSKCASRRSSSVSMFIDHLHCALSHEFLLIRRPMSSVILFYHAFLVSTYHACRVFNCRINKRN